MNPSIGTKSHKSEVKVFGSRGPFPPPSDFHVVELPMHPPTNIFPEVPAFIANIWKYSPSLAPIEIKPLNAPLSGNWLLVEAVRLSV